MSYTPSILAQVLKNVDRLKFDSLVKEMQNDRYVKQINTWTLFVVTAFAHISEVKSMRHLVLLLKLFPKKRYHLGIPDFSLNGLSNALSKRSSEVFRQLFYHELGKLKRQKCKLNKDLNNFISIVDSTSIPFRGQGSDWAQGGSSRREARAHVLIDSSGLPLDMVVTGASVHDLRGFEKLNLGETEILLMDRAYYGYDLWKYLNQKEITFVTRAKSNMVYEVVSNRLGRKPKGVYEDQIIDFKKSTDSKAKPLRLRRITVETPDGRMTFISNDLESPAVVIGKLYKMRWEIEKFFKWVKQNLKIKRFIARNKNAIEIQLWVALILYLVIWRLKISMKYNGKLIELIRTIRAKIMDNVEIGKLIKPTYSIRYSNLNQYFIFDSSGH